MKSSKIVLDLSPNQVKAYNVKNAKTTLNTLKSLGISMTDKAIEDIDMYLGKELRGIGYAGDSITTPSISTPLQFLQAFFPEVIETVTAIRQADNIMGRTIVGSWKDEEVILPILEKLGRPKPYTDQSNFPLADINVNYEKRSILRFEEGLEVNILEEERSQAGHINISNEKRQAVAEGLDIEANEIAFYGYNDGTNNTYGLLNDPNLPAYVTVNPGVSGSGQWKLKTGAEIMNDFKTAFSALRKQSGGNFDPFTDSFTICLPIGCIDYLQGVILTAEIGMQTLENWIKASYPNGKIIAVPQFDEANGGDNIFYIIAEKIKGKKVIHNFRPETFRILGIEKRAKGFSEVYSNSTAGVMVAYPIGVVRYTGI
ncbi:MAG: DUF2184 domain-containing protein [Elusimicrobiota bacterium]|jgi:hypothetical protein|nr:DUF2184 domain-containing protein [Elusimicrobiota bacterium]